MFQVSDTYTTHMYVIVHLMPSKVNTLVTTLKRPKKTATEKPNKS